MLHIQDYQAQGQLANYIFQTGFVITGGGFLSYCNNQLIKFEKNNKRDNFVIMKRDR